MEGAGRPDGPQPPPWLRPGQLRVLRSGRADPTAVTATLVDLAVRGHLRIEETPRSGLRRSTADWTLVRAGRRPTEPLLEYERILLLAVFAARDEVTMSELRRTFGRDLPRVQQQLLADVAARGWIPADHAVGDRRYRMAGRVLRVVGTGVFLIGFAARFADLPWQPPFPVMVAALLVAALGGWIGTLGRRRPVPRTPAGDAVLGEVDGFCAELVAIDADRLPADSAAEAFSRCLPHAIALDLADEWSQRFARTAVPHVAGGSVHWYTGSAAVLSFTELTGCLSSFTDSCDSAMSSGGDSSGSSDGGGGFFDGGGGGSDSGGGGGGGGGGGD